MLRKYNHEGAKSHGWGDDYVYWAKRNGIDLNIPVMQGGIPGRTPDYIYVEFKDRNLHVHKDIFPPYIDLSTLKIEDFL